MKETVCPSSGEGGTELRGGLELVAGSATALFVPGDCPERFLKAFASGAGIVIIDLEDSVGASEKAKALKEALGALGQAGEVSMRALVRVNPVNAATHAEEIDALLELAETAHHGLLGLMLPKAEHPHDLYPLATRLSQNGLAFVPLVESAVGVVRALEIAQVPGVTRLAFGAVDYALDIDADVDVPSGSRVLDYPRSVMVVASRAAGIAAPIDSPSTEIRNVGSVVEAARSARAFGYGGKLCIHPKQVEVVEEAFQPSEVEVEWARSVFGSTASVGQLNGQMVDAPVIERARRLLARVRDPQTIRD